MKFRDNIGTDCAVESTRYINAICRIADHYGESRDKVLDCAIRTLTLTAQIGSFESLDLESPIEPEEDDDED